ncbi:ExbD/TolR family protein [Vibrio palustris]|uniref:Biopolymer transport protein ExbD n=1 Tax=Vibrio palustris TaxID=1918946 RepID=A0A1R4B4S9_9VIBR|nr:biopolymer transporter ExbD [Vibrio palustris]SJL83924.1 biopolymer transport protein ExbD [Vibrio palustris]
MIDINELEDDEPTTNDGMTAMIDVIFVLIAFMMLMINVPMTSMKVDLPKASEQPAVHTVEHTVINIALLVDDDHWYLDGQPLADRNTLIQQLRTKKDAQPTGLSVVVHSDRKVPMERIVRLFSAIKSVGLDVTHIALDRPGNR